MNKTNQKILNSAPGIITEIEKIIKKENWKKGSKILDCACGNGLLTDYLCKKGFKCIGVDIKDLRISKKIHFKRQNLNEKFKFKDDSFDYVISIETIEHLENPRHFFREIRRILKKKGRFILTTPNNENWFSKFYFFLFNVFPFFRKHYYIKTGHITPLFYFIIKEIVNENNFIIKKISFNRSILPFLMHKFPNFTKKIDILPKNFFFGEIAIFTMELKK
ncbi:MAG: class I SAM-dependent methyltransferase [Promethearchaeota archaeon]